MRFQCLMMLAVHWLMLTLGTTSLYPQAETGKTAKPILHADDFHHEGYYEVANYFEQFNADDVFGGGLTHRFVDGQLQFLYTGFNGNNAKERHTIREFALPSKLQQRVRMVASYRQPWLGWDDNLAHKSLWWDPVSSRLWSGSGFDYPQGGITVTGTSVIYSRGLGDGVCVNHSGWFGFQGIGQRALWGKIQRIPEWFRRENDLPELISLSGGYTSLMSQGLGPSLGPMFVAFGDLSKYTPAKSYIDKFNVPAGDRLILADHRSGTTEADWYAQGFARRERDRGVRITPVANYFDGGDPRMNPQSRPTAPPAAKANWLSPAPGDPDGWGRWTWGDTYGGTGCWVDQDERHGIVMTAKLASGHAYYQTSACEADNFGLEIHVFDPKQLVAVKNKQLEPFKVRPSSIANIRKIMPSTWSKCNAVAATYVPETNRLYVLTFGCGTRDGGPNPESKSLLHVFNIGR